MDKNVKIYIAGFAIIALMCVVFLYMANANGDDLGGADDGAESVILGEEDEETHERSGGIDPDYDVWTSGIWGDYELPGETESLLFALQAAIGAIIIGYFIGMSRQKKQNAE